MNLKEAFRYQSFLNDVLTMASRSIENMEHCLNVVRNHLKHAANPDAVDEVETVEVDAFHSNDEVLRFIQFLISEKVKLSEAITKTKMGLPFDIDAAVTANKYRQSACSALKTMLQRSVPAKRMERSTAYKFNVEGNQTSYFYDVEVVRTPAYNVDESKRIYKALLAEADKVSADIDAAMVNAVVDYEPPFNVNDEFDDAIEGYLGRE